MAGNINYQDNIIQTIKKIRLEKNISQAKLSELLGISRGQIGNIENPNYTHKYTLKQIVAICKHLDYPIEKIFLPDVTVAPECSNAINSLMDSIIKYE
ncbi:MAG: helix-turn-helix transcriptional regulator [Bacteroidales bacterium]|jgi:transcriptional regulator with XRE-family HTH domain|nr:helix-turn-helix transcriptional regulator [Bacteroidales bacterium]